MKHSSLLGTMLIIMCFITIMLVVFVTVVFSILGNSMYVHMRTNELVPRATAIATAYSKIYLDAKANGLREDEIWRQLREVGDLSKDATVYMLNTAGTGIICGADNEGGYNGGQALISKYFNRVIKGQRVTISSQKIGVLVGVPVFSKEEQVIGAVLMIMNIHEVQTALQKLSLELGIAMLAVTGLLIIPIYIVFNRVTRPIRHVTDVALSMANGNLDVRADEMGGLESKRLAKSFNVMAAALQANINDLMIERNRLHAVLDGLSEGIIAVDVNGTITHFNHASLQILHGGTSEHPAAIPAYADVAKQIFKTLDNGKRSDADIKIGNAYIHVTVTPIYEDNDMLYGAVALIWDITESERLEQTRRDYVANVSHELRTPLASIRSLADALNDGLVKDQEDVKRYYGYILRESIRLSRLIDDLLELSRLQSGGIALTKRKIELYEIAFDVADWMNETAENSGKKVVLKAEEKKYYDLSNSDRVEQVLIALVDNAIKHGSENCTITVDINSDEKLDAYVVSVSNEAEIEPEVLDHLFERFYKADTAHTGEGTGLGLAIVSEILGLLNEKFTVDYKNGIICFSFTAGKYKKDEKAEYPSEKCLPPIEVTGETVDDDGSYEE